MHCAPSLVVSPTTPTLPRLGLLATQHVRERFSVISAEPPTGGVVALELVRETVAAVVADLLPADVAGVPESVDCAVQPPRGFGDECLV